jgi:hypothetical protein
MISKRIRDADIDERLDDLIIEYDSDARKLNSLIQSANTDLQLEQQFKAQQEAKQWQVI